MLINARKTDLDELAVQPRIRKRRARGRGREGEKEREGEKGREGERMIKSKAQRQNKFQKANVGAISRMTQACAWSASSGCGVGIKSNFLYICHLLGVGFVFSFNLSGD